MEQEHQATTLVLDEVVEVGQMLAMPLHDATEGSLDAVPDLELFVHAGIPLDVFEFVDEDEAPSAGGEGEGGDKRGAR